MGVKKMRQGRGVKPQIPSIYRHHNKSNVCIPLKTNLEFHFP